MEGPQLFLMLIPLVIIQLGLMVLALVDLVKRERVRYGSKPLWALIIILINIVGPVLYLLWGREGDYERGD